MALEDMREPQIIASAWPRSASHMLVVKQNNGSLWQMSTQRFNQLMSHWPTAYSSYGIQVDTNRNQISWRKLQNKK